ncbi:glutathione S-transferase [Undibacterium sp. RTI2.1]|uniref:glutathione S-transferase family protein n=1 Tax=unclassified Undibacterium TaxID=2630295 RepID=UPI002AB34F0C|nr:MULTISPECIES: glutathione S-transferase [unclassified Undibacterium]MDY7540240.1 glutathione S-transferase [Undibacterium sp. 5I1]MEB0031103.1 glutathione S-transferase [Undibacterium sp. RTI2.1]MEB0115305.1 glutathione S-transferase [Undibacterium sp. RTI2.2]MEB0231404.1 glutathione S-transferase [Undibacterium sp. 10I3]MEB0257167.1 glutathione S-transferase [Undibacterium sp. 5I1]
MIKVHHLNNSRSQRILWLLEELGVDYDIVNYQRDPVTRLAPAALKAIHPLGKSPVISDDDLVVAESGAIIEYLVNKYGDGRLRPKLDTAAYIKYSQWMHFAEGSAMLPLLLALYVGRLGEAGAPLGPRISSEIDNHISYISAELGDNLYLMGNELSAADIQISFVVEIAEARKMLGAYPNLQEYAKRLHANPAYIRALERGGPYSLGA